MTFINNIKKYFSYTIYSAKSQLKSEVAGSYLNWIWWILEPLCMMFIYIFLVQIVFNAEEKYFPVFVLIGITLWDFISRMLKGSVKLLSNNKNIITKVYIPKYSLLIAKSFTYIFKMLISFILIIIFIIIFKIKIKFTILFIIPLFIILYLFSFGISLLLMHFGVYVEDLNNVVRISLKLLFYISGIFYSIKTMVPAPFNEILLYFNPYAFFIDSFRTVIIDGNLPNLLILIIWTSVALILNIIGIKLISKYENSYAKVVV